MSEAEDDDFSDVEVDDDFDDFDPLDDDDGEAAGEAVNEEAPNDEGGSDDDGSDDDDLKGPRPADRQAAQAVDTRAIVVVDDEDRITSNVMTKAEVTRAIAIRAEHMTRYPSAFTDIGGLTQAKDIARKELYDHRSPLVLRRPVGRTAAGERIIEKWKVREMSYPPLN